MPVVRGAAAAGVVLQEAGSVVLRWWYERLDRIAASAVAERKKRVRIMGARKRRRVLVARERQLRDEIRERAGK